jgi:hypothetical protein
MKRCPTCNQTFSEGWLSFCTQDGTTLVDDSVSKSEPPPTMMGPAPPPVSYPNPPARVTDPNSPANWNAPSGGFVPGQFSPPQPIQPGWQPPQPIQPGWQPPPPPAYATPKQGLAIASMICGIFSITFGWCCSIGVMTSIAAIVLGGISLSQIKNDPDQNTGKPLALTGIITASAYLVFWILILLIWGFGALLGGFRS